jgi:hypothetical protein
MRDLIAFTAFVALVVGGNAVQLLQNEPTILYADVSPKLRIITKSSAFSGLLATDIECVFTPIIDPSIYTLNVANDIMLSLSLVPGKKWMEAPAPEGNTIFLVELKVQGSNVLEGASDVAMIIPTPSVVESDQLIYIKATRQFAINGTHFRNKKTELIFEPPLVRNQDYILNVASTKTLVLTRTTGHQWRGDPGPLKLRRIDTGGGQLRVNADGGGIVVAEVQADLDTHGVTVESTPNERAYQSTGKISVIGTGFNPVDNHMRFANGLRGHGVNYTTIEHTENILMLELAKGGTSKWRRNAKNLPGPLLLLAVDAGGGFVAVGPTEAKKGRAVATIFEDPFIEPSTKTIFAGHSHELWVVGKGFTRGDYKTSLSFDPPIEERIPSDITMLVYNRTHLKLTIFAGEKWMSDKITQPIGLKVTSVNTGPGPITMNGDGTSHGSVRGASGSGKGVQIATIFPDEKQHADVQVFRSTSQALYQTAYGKSLVIEGSGFTNDMNLNFDNGLVKDLDYSMRIKNNQGAEAELTLLEGKRWRDEGGALRVMSVVLPSEDAQKTIDVGSGGEGVAVAEILDDPFVTSGERIIFATHTKTLTINGYGFVLDDTSVVLSPTPQDAFVIESVEPYRIVLRLREGYSWSDDVWQPGDSVDLRVTKIDTRAGKVKLGGTSSSSSSGKGVVVAKVEPDLDDNNCDDSCEYAFDGLCDDGTSTERDWYDDDYGGFYGYDDGQYYDYGYYYYGDDFYDDDTFLAAICDVGTDCTDCGGPLHPSEAMHVECDNSCQWSNDGFCDDDRTSGLCNAGTDCHDCGPVGYSNFTSLFGDDWEWNADGDTFWDDDDNYWAGDDELAYAPVDSLTDKGRMNDGAGSIFINAMQSIVYLAGIIFCSGGLFIGYQMYKTGNSPVAFPVSDGPDQMEMMIPKKAGQIPITPDIIMT